MDRSSAVRALNPAAARPSSEDADLWGRVLSHLQAEAPLPAVLARPWGWLNHRSRAQSVPRTCAEILPFRKTPKASEATQD